MLFQANQSFQAPAFDITSHKEASMALAPIPALAFGPVQTGSKGQKTAPLRPRKPYVSKNKFVFLFGFPVERQLTLFFSFLSIFQVKEGAQRIATALSLAKNFVIKKEASDEDSTYGRYV